MTVFSNTDPVLEIKNLSIDYGFTENEAQDRKSVV